MVRKITISILITTCVFFLPYGESEYLDGKYHELELQNTALKNLENDLDFLLNEIERPIRVCWLGTLLPNQKFTNANVPNFKQFTVVLQAVLAPSILKYDDPADVYLMYLSDDSSKTQARQMFGKSIVIDENGYAFVTK